MDITEDVVSTLRAEAHHPPLVLSFGFKPGQSSKARTLGYERERSPTLSSLTPAVLLVGEDNEQYE